MNEIIQLQGELIYLVDKAKDFVDVMLVSLVKKLFRVADKHHC